MVAVAVLGLEDVGTVVLVAVVVVLAGVAAGFSEGFALGPVVGSPAAGLASAGDLSVPSPGTSPLSCVPSSKNRQIRLSNFDTLMPTASGRAGAVAAGPPAA